MACRRNFRHWFVGLLVVGSAGPLAAQTPGESREAVSFPRQPLLSSKEAVRITTVLAATMLVDGAIREDLQESRSPLTNSVAHIGNSFGNPKYLVPVLGAAGLIGRVTGHAAIARAALRAGEAGVLASGISGLIKFGLGRVRPLDGADPDRFRPLNGKGAFPSGHTTVAFAVATVLARETPDRWTDAGLYGLASLTGLSRLNDDRHWTSDVAAGALVGYLVGRHIVRRSAEADHEGAHFMVMPRGFGFSTAF